MVSQTVLLLYIQKQKGVFQNISIEIHFNLKPIPEVEQVTA